MTHTISPDFLSLDAAFDIIAAGVKVELGEESRRRVADCRRFLDERLSGSDEAIYGINTGFGSLCDTIIDRDSLELLQKNLVTSHACGVGRMLRPDIIRLMLLLKVQGLSYGHSGVTVETVERLLWHLNEDVLPVVYEQGSLGASGDLAPLAHLSLPLLGLGEVIDRGTVKPAGQVLKERNLQPLTLQSKEGLALLNGTQFMSAFGVYAGAKAKRLMQWADTVAAMSMEAFDARPDPFVDSVHALRRQPGQRKVAAHIRHLLQDSDRFHGAKQHVQDPYSFRCIPQVHGATRDALDHVFGIFENEINAVTDNPTIVPDEDAIVSAGNFHGQPLAISLDFMSIAVAELGSISERRTYKLINGLRNLPAFLIPNPGLNSGFMIPQYTAASIVSKNKQLCTPASVDTIDSSNGQEDHVSMGANAAVKTLEVVENAEWILAIELLNAAQALNLRGTDGIASKISDIHRAYRRHVPFVEADRELQPLIAESKKFMESFELEPLPIFE